MPRFFNRCVAIWKYDKRVFNKSPVVYFGMQLLPIDHEPELLGMVEYIKGVLDALGITDGAMHSEVGITYMAWDCLPVIPLRAVGLMSRQRLLMFCQIALNRNQPRQMVLIEHMPCIQL